MGRHERALAHLQRANDLIELSMGVDTRPMQFGGSGKGRGRGSVHGAKQKSIRVLVSSNGQGWWPATEEQDIAFKAFDQIHGEDEQTHANGITIKMSIGPFGPAYQVLMVKDSDGEWRYMRDIGPNDNVVIEPDGEKWTCPICFQSSLMEDPGNSAVSCHPDAPPGHRHTFHSQCLHNWQTHRASSVNSKKCPYCRQKCPGAKLTQSQWTDALENAKGVYWWPAYRQQAKEYRSWLMAEKAASWKGKHQFRESDDGINQIYDNTKKKWREIMQLDEAKWNWGSWDMPII